jgi:hypothetical protein
VTPLPELLTRAAGTEPAGFDAVDVRSRFVRRQRRQRAVLAAAVVLVALALGAGAFALTGPGDPDGPADRLRSGPVTGDELSAAPWVLTARDGAAVGDDVAVSVTFASGGWLLVDTGCASTGSWELDAGRLLTDDVGPERLDCEPRPDPTLVGVFAASPDVGRIAGRAGSLELRTGTRTLAFDRADRIGRPAPADELVGTWRSETDRLRFAADGTLLLGVPVGESPCELDGTWEQDDEGHLRIAIPSSNESGLCELLSRGEADPYEGPSTVRLDGDRLFIATRLYVVQLRR